MDDLAWIPLSISSLPCYFRRHLHQLAPMDRKFFPNGRRVPPAFVFRRGAS